MKKTNSSSKKSSKKNLFKELSKPFEEKAVQRTKGAVTKKGYDTTGFGYQYLVNRFNEVLGVGGWNWRFKVMKEEEGVFKNSGTPFWEVTGRAEIMVKVDGKKITHGEFGGHRAGNYADALKGASTNAFKKTAAFFGVGKQAFEGSIDIDNLDVVGFDRDKMYGKPKKMVIDYIGEMEESLSKDTVDEWEIKIKNSDFNDNQKLVLERKLDELKKKL